jgi:hypothetical protein
VPEEVTQKNEAPAKNGRDPKHGLQEVPLGSATLTIALVFFINIFLFRLILALAWLLASLLLTVLLLALLSSLAALAMLSALAELTSLLAFLFHVLIFHVVRHQYSSSESAARPCFL